MRCNNHAFSALSLPAVKLHHLVRMADASTACRLLHAAPEQACCPACLVPPSSDWSITLQLHCLNALLLKAPSAGCCMADNCCKFHGPMLWGSLPTTSSCLCTKCS